MKLGRWILVAALITSSGMLHAQSSAEQIGQCLADNTSGKDRKELAAWLFSGMAQHPEVAKLASIPEVRLAGIQDSASSVFNRLYQKDCRAELAKALAEGDQQSIQSGFEVLGKLAMQELMSNPAVSTYFNTMSQRIDLSSFKHK